MAMLDGLPDLSRCLFFFLMEPGMIDGNWVDSTVGSHWWLVDLFSAPFYDVCDYQELVNLMIYSLSPILSVSISTYELASLL
jgi:hypothetical protein